MKQNTKGYFYAAIAVVMWSTVASAFKITLRYTGVLTMLFYSSLTSTVLFFLALSTNRKLLQIKDLRKARRSHFALAGLLNPFLYYIFLFGAYSRLPAQQAQPLNFTWPIVLSLLAIFMLGQKPKLSGFVAIIISFVGVIIISTRGNLTTLKFSDTAGVFLALCSSVIWAFYWVYNLKEKTNEVVKLFLSFVYGTLFITIIWICSGHANIPDLIALAGSIYIGCFEMGITFIIWYRALKFATNTINVASLIYLVPFLSLIVIHFILNETIHISTIAGLILIVAGILLGKVVENNANTPSTDK
jgi:drug/metabolite transporter (DMT)-like permease